jgi:hypothetical protein
MSDLAFNKTEYSKLVVEICGGMKGSLRIKDLEIESFSDDELAVFFTQDGVG